MEMSFTGTIGIITIVLIVWIFIMSLLSFIFKRLDKKAPADIFRKLSLVGLFRCRKCHTNTSGGYGYNGTAMRAASESAIANKYKSSVAQFM